MSKFDIRKLGKINYINIFSLSAPFFFISSLVNFYININTTLFMKLLKYKKL